MHARGFIGAIMAMVLLLCGARATEAQDACGLPSEIDALIVGMQLTLPTTGRLSSLQRARLAGLGAAINADDVKDALRKSDLEPTHNAISSLVDKAKQIAAAGAVANKAKVQGQLDAALKMVRALCAQRAARIDRQLKRAGKLQPIDNTPRAKGWLPSGLEAPKDRSFVALALLAPLVLGLTSAIILARRLYDWFLVFAFSRKSCRITAAVEHDLDIIDGHILIIGRRGVKFQPVNEGAYHRLEDLGEDQSMNLLVGHHCLPGVVETLKDGYAAFFFDERIQNEFIDILLKSSAIKPRYERTPPPKRKKARKEPGGLKAIASSLRSA